MLAKNKILSKKAKARIDQQKIDLKESLRGLKGDQGIQGEQGIQGPQGKAGINGKAGMNGEAGPRGPRGPQGEQGPKGTRGEPGTNGTDGADGRGILRLQIRSMDLIVTYTDGEKVNLGRVVGDRGPKGDRGRSGFAFGDTINNTTNITEEVLSPEDSANLALIADNSTESKINAKEQLLRIEKELRYIKTHLHIVTDEKITESDIGRDEQ
jgi:hypothetical protein